MIEPSKRIELNGYIYKIPTSSKKDVIYQTRGLENKTTWRVLSLKSAVQNITEQQKAEENLLKDKKFFDFLLNNLTGIFYVLDTNGCFLDWNKNLETVLGYPANELKEINAVNLFDGDEKEIIAQKITEVFEKGKAEVEAKLVAKNGDKILYRFIAKAADFEGMSCLIGIGIDVSEQRAEAISNYDEVKYNVVGTGDNITLGKEIGRELLIKELVKRNEDLKQFCFITSHNLRAPISNITGILDVMDYSTIDEYNCNMLDMLKASTKQLSTTVEDISNILLIQNNSNAEVCFINIKVFFEEIQKTFLNDLHAVSGNIITDFKISEINFNKTYLESIFINLISNAIKYRSSNRNLILNISTYTDIDGNYIIAFSDNGIGIDLNKNKNKVFGLYQRFNNEVEGHGLGLFIIKTQINALGGSIEVESEVDKGTTFKIKFR